MGMSRTRPGSLLETRSLLPLVLADDLTEGLVVIDPESRIRYANPAMTRIFGYGQDELEGASLTRLMPEGYRERHLEALQRYLATGARSLPWSEVELPGRHRNGETLDLRISFTEFSRGGEQLFAGTIRHLLEGESAEEEQRILARSYRALFENDVAAVFRAAPDGRILAANGALARMAGYESPAELQGRDLTAFYAESDSREELARDLREHREVRNRELQLERADATLQWSLVNAVWIDDPTNREPEALVGTVVDISDRKRIERELGLSLERYRRLFDQELVGVFRSGPGPDGEILECNQAFADLFGYESPEQVAGTPGELFYPEGEAREATVEMIREHGTGFTDELRLQRQDGSIVWALTYVRLLEDPEYGEILEGAIFDVSDRVRAREALKQAKEKFRGVFDISPVALKILQPESDDYLDVNQTFQEMFGYGRDEVLNGSVTSDDLWEEPEERRHLYRRLREGETVRNAEVRLRRKDGTVFDALFSASDLHQEDERFLVAAVQDITAQVDARREVEAAEERWATAIELAPVGIVISEVVDGRVHTVNRAAASILGYEREELLDSTAEELDTWVDGTEREELIEQLEEDGMVRAREVRLRHRTGEVRLVQASVRALELGGEKRLLWTLEDVTQEKERDEALRRSEARHRTLVETMAEATLIMDREGRITFANREAEEMLVLERSEIQGRTYDDPAWRITAPDGGTFPQEKLPFRQVLATGRPIRNVEFGLEQSDGARRIISINAAPLYGTSDALEGVVATFRDVTEQHRMERELRHQALHDGLTGLPNRTLFWDRLDHALQRCRRTGERIAVFFLDLDGFKRINDEHGHGAGDEALRHVAGRLRSVIRDADTLARLGGDEFGVLLEDLGEDSDADEAARRLTDRFDVPVPVDGEEALIRVSCGIALAGGDIAADELTADALVHHADRAMYVAKEEPGSAFRRYDGEMVEERTGRLRREIRLNEALEEGEVIPHFQPIVDMEDGRIVGGEVLARWTDSEWGPVSPGEFIPLAEETGLIVELGRLVAGAACGQLSEWTADGHLPDGFRLHLNLSARELDRPDIVDFLDGLYRDLGLDADQVAIEVTESVAIGGAGVLEAIRDRGSPVAVDDFGTQYATLERLATLALDSLKLDRLFVDQIGKSVRHEAVLEASLTLAESMGLRPVAEGVETERQRDWLLEHGCRYAQGFLFAPAVPADEFTEWLRSGIRLPT